MKRVFPLITVLITLSVLGIMFIQMQWIHNGLLLKQEQHQRDIDNAMKEVKYQLYEAFLYKRGYPYNAPADVKEMFLNSFYTAQTFTSEEINNTIEALLRKNKIKYPFEYKITNFFNVDVRASKDFQRSYLSNAHKITLTPDNSLQVEILYLYIKEPRNFLLGQMGWMIVASIAFTCIIISAFSLTIRTMFRQKKLSEIKSDFINNMTHEFKTPLATISLASDALTNEKVINDPEKIRYYSGLIKEENKRMNKQVERILQSARIEREDEKINLQERDAHDIISKVAENFALQIKEREGQLSLNLQAPKSTILADDVHFSNIIFNLLDNAVKYSGGKPIIEVSTQLSGEYLLIRFKDNGIGMNKETQNRIFEKFYRAHTGNLHNVKGFGLGLSYVKVMVEAHNGRIKVESTPGKGSTFTISLPVTRSP